jgi:hypothetical protein
MLATPKSEDIPAGNRAMSAKEAPKLGRGGTSIRGIALDLTAESL